MQQPLHTDLAADTSKGLSANPKYLLSKYFYDERGSELFQQIMHMPEYYLTDCEMEIIKTHKQGILETICDQSLVFELIELGAGDGMKSKVLLKHLCKNNTDFKYIPVDISETAVENLVLDIQALFPTLRVSGQIGDYFQLLQDMSQKSCARKVIMFLGSNIGNMDHEQSLEFLKKIRAIMHWNDLLFIGFDLKKDPGIINKAYNDPHGITAAFNLNLLQRINNELQADFNLDQFRHTELYDPATGTAKSYLISMCRQQVRIAALGKTYDFEKDEGIYMEMSQKYDPEMISELAGSSGFEIVRNFTDQRQFFINSIWKPKIEKK